MNNYIDMIPEIGKYTHSTTEVLSTGHIFMEKIRSIYSTILFHGNNSFYNQSFL